MSMHPWLKSYPPEVRWEVPIPAITIQQVLDEAAARWPGNYALDFMGRRYKYPELAALVERAAAGFQRLGVGPGVKVGLYLPNTPHYPIAFLGVLKAGGVVVNYSPLDTVKALEHKVEDSETDIMLTLDIPQLLPQMQALMGKTRLKHLIVGQVAEPVPFASLLDNDGKFTTHPHGDLA